MAINFQEDLVIPPLPLSDVEAVALSKHYAAAITSAESAEAAARVAVDNIIESASEDGNTEHQRLHRLYTQVYTRTELENLMLNTYASLGLGG